ncbi:phosphoribosylaminoimidazolesuccinocarboxamide synthase, partial [Faecalibacterium prausnitzii]
MTEFKHIKEGKVREIYDNCDRLIMFDTERISAFEFIMIN